MKEESTAENVASVVDGEVISDIENLESQLKSDGDFVPESSDTKPEQERESSGIGEMCSMLIEVLCGKMAQAYNEPLLALTKPEKEGLTESINDVAKHYDFDAHPLVGLGMVGVAVSLPRYMTIQAIIEAHESKESGDGDGNKS